MNIVCEYTYGEYQKKNISDEIFIETMKFCTRYLNEHLRNLLAPSLKELLDGKQVGVAKGHLKV